MSPLGHLTGWPAVWSAGLSKVDSDPVTHLLDQMAVDIFEDLVILLGEAAQNVLHRLEALLPIVDLWIVEKRDKREVRWGRKVAEKNDVGESAGRMSGE